MNKIFSKQKLTEYSKEALIALFLSQQQMLISQEEQLKDLNTKMDLLIEQVMLSK